MFLSNSKKYPVFNQKVSFSLVKFQAIYLPVLGPVHMFKKGHKYVTLVQIHIFDSEGHLFDMEGHLFDREGH